jgi:hypothetical protein
MNIILHGETETRLHMQDLEQVQQRITVPVRVFTKSKNKWSNPLYVEHELVYKFACQIGSYYHYNLKRNNERP